MHRDDEDEVSLRPILRTTQILLWSMCVLVVLVGVVLFTRAFLIADDRSEEAAAAAEDAADDEELEE